MIKEGGAGGRGGGLRAWAQQVKQVQARACFGVKTSLAEQLVELVLAREEVSAIGPVQLKPLLTRLRQRKAEPDSQNLKVMVLGGGTGLSNIVGGDSRHQDWPLEPFAGLKEIFPQMTGVVCVTDDGGSTGQLLKELPLVALGDLRHVLLSGIQCRCLQKRYGLDTDGCRRLVTVLHALFNYRFTSPPASAEILLAGIPGYEDELPAVLRDELTHLVKQLFIDLRLKKTLVAGHCLGNLILVAAIYRYLPVEEDNQQLLANQQQLANATLQGIRVLGERLGVGTGGVVPCTTTSAVLQFLYANGVQVTGEYKSGHARRGFPVDRVRVRFSQPPIVDPGLLIALRKADIIIFAPGSLYSSIIPILQVPGISQAIRDNQQALKVLIANFWVQKGETDAAQDAPERKFHVSDLILAYQRNTVGGVDGLFSYVLAMSLHDIAGTVLQSYGLEDKLPIYLDRKRVRALGFEPVTARIFSDHRLSEYGMIQHDPLAIAKAIRALWHLCSNGLVKVDCCPSQPTEPEMTPVQEVFHAHRGHLTPCLRFTEIKRKLRQWQFFFPQQLNKQRSIKEASKSHDFLKCLAEIIWQHQDIGLEHLKFIKGVMLIARSDWHRCQHWDNIYSFYDPVDGLIKIREDVVGDPKGLEVAFLVGLGESLLGNYVASKKMRNIHNDSEVVGQVFLLTLRSRVERVCFFTEEALERYLCLARMRPAKKNSQLYTRVTNDQEGFTPPGLLFGLLFSWYLDNGFCSHVEYKMAIMGNPPCRLIPEQVKIVDRRQQLIQFFREVVFNFR